MKMEYYRDEWCIYLDIYVPPMLAYIRNLVCGMSMCVCVSVREKTEQTALHNIWYSRVVMLCARNDTENFYGDNSNESKSTATTKNRKKAAKMGQRIKNAY